jgi:hypothetical protein
VLHPEEVWVASLELWSRPSLRFERGWGCLGFLVYLKKKQLQVIKREDASSQGQGVYDRCCLKKQMD